MLFTFVDDFVLEFAKILDHTSTTARFAREAGVTAVQYQPVVGILLEFIGDVFE